MWVCCSSIAKSGSAINMCGLLGMANLFHLSNSIRFKAIIIGHKILTLEIASGISLASLV